MAEAVQNGRVAAQIDGDFVVFLIGMRVNRLLAVGKWMPVAMAMPRMLKELMRQPELGLLSARAYVSGRVILTLQTGSGLWRVRQQKAVH
jgi:Domain of unknown function (DUF4188)